MTLREFHNALRLILNIDMHELVEAGVIAKDDKQAWNRFRLNPYRWLIMAPDDAADKLWALMEKRMK